MGAEVKSYEADFAAHFGSRYAVMVSSGSAANLLGIAALVYSGRLKAGDEVIVPAVSWSTTYFPLTQMGLRLRFVDIDPDTLNIDVALLDAAITDATRMVFAVNLLGNPCDYSQLRAICEAHDLILAEDNCESMGASFQEKMCGTFGVFGTFSSFYSHHIATMEGGVVLTDDEELYHFMLSLRAHGWTRDLPKTSQLYSKNPDPFYESYNFILPGFNLRPLEMEAAIGREQIIKLDGLVSQRILNEAYLKEALGGLRGFRRQRPLQQSSWFGFAFIIDPDCDVSRDQVVKQLTNSGIEVRPIVAGNFTRNPVISYLPHSIAAPLTAADDIHKNGFFVGNHGHDMRRELDYFASVMSDVLNGK